MAQVTWQPTWISDSFFEIANPETAKIVSTEVLQSNGKNDIIVQLASERMHVRMSVYGENLKHLIDALGNDTDDWTGATLRVSQTNKDGKKRRILHVRSQQA